MTWIRQKNYVQFYFSTTPDEAGKWHVWVREFVDHTLTKPVNQHTLIETYDTAEEAKAKATEFQSVSNQ